MVVMSIKMNVGVGASNGVGIVSLKFQQVNFTRIFRHKAQGWSYIELEFLITHKSVIKLN